MRLLIAVAMGGAIGASARYLLAGVIQRNIGGDFPWGILLVNVIGCLAMGALTELMALRWSTSPEIRALLTVGVLGGFTTFSSFALDTATLASRGGLALPIGYVLGSVLLSIMGFYAGLLVVRHLLP